MLLKPALLRTDLHPHPIHAIMADLHPNTSNPSNPGHGRSPARKPLDRRIHTLIIHADNLVLEVGIVSLVVVLALRLRLSISVVVRGSVQRLRRDGLVVPGARFT